MYYVHSTGRKEEKENNCLHRDSGEGRYRVLGNVSLYPNLLLLKENWGVKWNEGTTGVEEGWKGRGREGFILV